MKEETDAQPPKEQYTSEAFVEVLETQVRQVFPDFVVTERTEFDAYDARNDDVERGQILFFYTEHGRDDNASRILIIFHEKNRFVINYYNSHEPENSFTHRNVTSSILRDRNKYWEEGRIRVGTGKSTN